MNQNPQNLYQSQTIPQNNAYGSIPSTVRNNKYNKKPYNSIKPYRNEDNKKVYKIPPNVVNQIKKQARKEPIFLPPGARIVSNMALGNQGNVEDYHNRFVVPELQKLKNEKKSFKERAIQLNIENMRFKKLQSDIPTQLQQYLNEVQEENDILDMKILKGLPIEDYNNNFGGSDPNSKNFNMPNFHQGNGRMHTNEDGGEDYPLEIDLRPALNYKLVEPLDPMDQSDAINKKIDVANLRREKAFREKLKIREKRIDGVIELARNTPAPPDIPQMYSFTSKMEYPIDFNMTTYNIMQRDISSKNKQDSVKFNSQIVAPLKIAIQKIRFLRSTIEDNIEKRDKAFEEGQKIFKEKKEIENQKDVPDYIIEEQVELVEENLEEKRKKYRSMKGMVEKQIVQIDELKVTIKNLKLEAIESLKGLAKKEYLGNPNNIFDFPENNKIRELEKKAKQAMMRINEQNVEKAEEQARREQGQRRLEDEKNKRRKRRDSGSSSSSSGSYTGSSSSSSSDGRN